MAKKAKLDCSAKKFGKRGTRLKIHIDAPNFGKMKFDLSWDLDSEELANLVMKHCTKAEEILDDMEVDNSPEGVKNYTETLFSLLGGLMEDVQKTYS